MDYLRHGLNFGVQLIPDWLNALVFIYPRPRIAPERSRQQWSSPLDFLMSSISMSVGLGNIWRFPYTAYKNGGGAFLIPYGIVLMLMSKPLYLLEQILGQFASYGPVKVWDMAPCFRGVGYGLMIGNILVYTYFCALMGLALFYVAVSFNYELPWTTCPVKHDEDNHYLCVISGNVAKDNSTLSSLRSMGPAEYYYTHDVIRERPDGLDRGLGEPEWRLSLALVLSWLLVTLVIIRGVHSSGKVAYFTALFPYIVLFIFLIQGVLLPGAGKGILYFVKPTLASIISPQVWYEAMKQSFYSLSIGFGAIIMNSSYNNFHHSIYRDTLVISLLDTFTSLLAGCTVFAILGNLAEELHREVPEVVSEGTKLAFVTYSAAIGKFPFARQLFSVLFFLMLFTLGAGSNVSMVSCTVTIICDQFPKWKAWIVTVTICATSCLVGIVFVTPGGLLILFLVDYYTSFIFFILILLEVIGVSWIYGVRNICKDAEFMLNRKIGWYLKLSWGIFIPVGLLFIFVYTLIDFEPPISGKYKFPIVARAIGWSVVAVALLQVPIWAVHAMYTSPETGFVNKLRDSLRPKPDWGPKNHDDRDQWIKFRKKTESIQTIPSTSSP